MLPVLTPYSTTYTPPSLGGSYKIKKKTLILGFLLLCRHLSSSDPKIWAFTVLPLPMATVGLGAGGKFRKKPFRRPHSTPYDRPPTAIRIPTIVPGADGDSWLRKLMDPAQKLLATTARRFYNSVFRKRLTQPLPSPSPPSQPPGLFIVGLLFPLFSHGHSINHSCVH